MPASASPHAGPTAEVLVAFLPDHGDRAADHRMLVALAARLAPLPLGATITHRCDACGSHEHGRPLVAGADGSFVDVHVSLSRAGGLVALAATLAGPLGIDIESLAAVRAAAFDDVAFDPDERDALRAVAEARGAAGADRMRALAWSAKEAVLKATGTGLRTDPRTLHLDLDGTSVRLSPRAHPSMSLHPFAAAGLFGHVAVAARAGDIPARYSLGRLFE